MPIPENIGLDYIQSSFFCLADKIWPHLQETQQKPQKIIPIQARDTVNKWRDPSSDKLPIAEYTEKPTERDGILERKKLPICRKEMNFFFFFLKGVELRKTKETH